MITKVDMLAIASLGVFVTGHAAGENPTAQNSFDQGAIDSSENFLEEFGESITYYPSGNIGDTVVGSGDIIAMATFGIFRADSTETSRSITAIVERQQPGPLDGAPHGHSPQLTIEVKNNSTEGISSSEVDTGGDQVTLAVRLGQTAQRRRITKILHRDAGMVKLEVR